MNNQQTFALITLIKNILIFPLIALILIGCNVPPPSTPNPQLGTPTPIPPTPTQVIPATFLPSPTPQVTPTKPATQMTPIATGLSEGMDDPSPDSRWLPYVDFNAQTLHFINTSNYSICDFPSSIHYMGPDHFIAWLPDGRVVVQAANGVKAGLPCSTFGSASSQEALLLNHSDPSFSPDGRYQVVLQSYQHVNQKANEKIELKIVSTGKTLVETVFMELPGGGGNLPGYWIDTNHFIIRETGDQGPLLLTPGKAVIKIATDIFQLPVNPGNGYWLALTGATQNPSHFYLMLIAPFGASNPLQIYDSATGRIETLPYLASQGGFSNDGHSLLVTQNNVFGPQHVLIRSLDEPGGSFQPFSDQDLPPTFWSPDGTRYFQVSKDMTTIKVYTSPGNAFLEAWQAWDYELSPSWSPDGKYLAVWGRKHLNYDQEAIFIIPIN